MTMKAARATLSLAVFVLGASASAPAWQRVVPLLLAAVLLAGTMSESAFARGGGRGGHSGSRHFHGHRVAVGVIVAAPAFWYLPVRTLAPPVVVAPAAPTVYIEHGNAQPAPSQAAAGWWYYCADTNAYYPYVKECAVEWQRVAAEPPAGR
jgi:hypothetical protein